MDGLITGVQLVAGLVGLKGFIMGVLTSVGFGVVNAFTGQANLTAEMIDVILKKHMTALKYYSIIGDISGEMKAMTADAIRLDGFVMAEKSGETETRDVVAAVRDRLVILGKMESHLRLESPNAQNKEQIAGIISILHAYVYMSAVQFKMLYDRQLLLSRLNHNTYNGVEQDVLVKTVKEAKVFLNKFLQVPPMEKDVHIIASFQPRSRDKPVAAFMNSIGAKVHLDTSPDIKMVSGKCYRIEMYHHQSWTWMTEPTIECERGRRPRGGCNGKRLPKIWMYLSRHYGYYVPIIFKRHGDHYTIGFYAGEEDKKYFHCRVHNDAKTRHVGYIDGVQPRSGKNPSDYELWSIVKTTTGKFYIVNKAIPWKAVKETYSWAGSGYYPNVFNYKKGMGEANVPSDKDQWWNVRPASC